MLRSALHSATSPATRQAYRIPTVCVVDPRPDDYQSWRFQAEAGGVRLICVQSAEQALRTLANQPVDLWVINTHLPGLSGCDLCGLLKGQSSRAVVYLVADEYSPAVERTAWQARPTLFGCKGAHEEWLSQWLELRRSGVPVASAGKSAA